MKKLLIVFAIFTSLSTSVHAVDITASPIYSAIATVKLVVASAITPFLFTTALFADTEARKDLEVARHDAFNRQNGEDSTEVLEIAMASLRVHFPKHFANSSEEELVDVLINDIHPMQ